MRICYIMNKVDTLVWSAPPTLMLYRMGGASHIQQICNRKCVLPS